MCKGIAMVHHRQDTSSKRLLPLILLPILLLVPWLSLQQPGHVQAADLTTNYSWKQLRVGGGGFVTGLVIHPTSQNVIYGRTDVGGAYRWDASSQSWSQIILANNIPNPTSGDYGVDSIAVSKQNDQVVYVAVGSTYDSSPYPDNGRILKSTDRGNHWSDSGQRWYINGNGDYRQGGERLAVDPNNDNVVYFGSRTEGLWVSTNAGGSWSQISTSSIPAGSNSSGTPAGVKFVVFDPSGGTTSDGKTERIYVGVAGQGIYRSDNAGGSWYNIYSTTQIPYQGIVAPDGTFYATFMPVSGLGSVQKYNLGTGSWSDITPPNGDTAYTVAIDPFNSQRLFVSPGGMRNDHFWRSTNGGSSWDILQVSISSTSIPWITQTDEANWLSSGTIVFDPFVQNKLWFPQGTGVWNATNLSDTTINWNFNSNGIEEMVANDVIAPPGGKAITVNQDRNGFYHANPDGYPDKTILTSKFSDGTSLDYSANNPSFVVAASSDTRYINPSQSGYSNDGGQTWNQFSGMANYSDLYGGNIAVSATDTRNIVWLPTNNAKPYVTTDTGASWNKLTFFNNVNNLHTMIWWAQKKALDSDKVIGGQFYIYSTENGGEFYRSSNNGQDWVKAPGQAPSSSNNDAHVFGQIRAVPGHAGHIWMSTAQGGLSYTTNAGDSWNKVSAVQDARAIGYGAAINGASYPAIFVYGKINNNWGVYRSVDQGASWDLVSSYPMNLADTVTTINGDMSIPGRVYVGFAGNGFVYGDDTTLSSSTPTSLAPIADRDNWAQSTGSENTLNVSIYQYSYLKFDLSSISSSINSAHLRVYRNNDDQGSITLTAYQVSDNSWVETSNTLPAPGSAISSITSPGIGVVDFDLTSYIQSAKASGTSVTIALNASCQNWQSVYSRENSTNQPALVIS
ncbi:CBM96 family carbohydrate-binding protein [Tengunoibacter tsumagoiensis]|uniref:Carbohydrate-binding module family 96 domain-containing protein n=1 Tax=Tengunoibacter tsumagoiensis TaxID=2014871 RepID=A0A401ZV56_9CHLR|nr:hypothetical protein [Tengunoibacter tsumagoiensis]GCE10773.1 hypothetical protein KTT_06320 [Tengunoibacter tsumagoiensis]